MKRLLALVLVGTALSVSNTFATWTFYATLTGAADGNGSTATGFGTVVLNDAQTQITVDESWTGLTGGPATASHIHGPAAPGSAAGVLFPFSGVPAATSGSIPEQTFAITPTQVGYLFGGLLYMNVHTGVYPAGEIRGQLVPEPSSLALVGVASAGLVAIRRRKMAQN